MDTVIETPSVKTNPLATEKIGKLLLRFGIPSVIALLVNSIYNIIDQVCIGHGIGILGNAATNVAFPLTSICLSFGLMMGIGGAANFNLNLGAGNHERAGNIIGNAIFFLGSIGILLFITVSIFLKPLLIAFGATEQVLPYAFEYTGITMWGIPFVVITTGLSHIVRADGSPKYSMFFMTTGAVLNMILDPLFMFGFGWGMAGVAWATVISQIISCLLGLRYLTRFKSVAITKKCFRPRFTYAKAIASLGVSSFITQIAMLTTQITMNNTLRHYGASSVYGSDIPIASAGVIMKVNMILFAMVIGVSQGSQPIIGFNYGARNYDRVKRAYWLAITAGAAITTCGFLLFQLIPREIISLFGETNEPYFRFAERYFRIFLFLTFINGIQPITSMFFTSIGKATRGIFLSLTRQILFLVPLILILPMFLGIDGIMYAGPAADLAAAILAVVFIWHEMKVMGKEPVKQNQGPIVEIDFLG